MTTNNDSKNDEIKNEKKDQPIHVYDQIVELDNPAPFWFNAAFIACILWAGAYCAYYLFGDGPTVRENMEAELKIIKNTQLSNNKAKYPEEKELLAVFANKENISKGKTHFVSKCASCHVDDGGGLIGPNLTDSFWINGDGKIAAIYKVVFEGVGSKGMPAWGGMLNEHEMKEVVSFVYSLKGTHPKKPKEPQGNKYE